MYLLISISIFSRLGISISIFSYFPYRYFHWYQYVQIFLIFQYQYQYFLKFPYRYFQEWSYRYQKVLIYQLSIWLREGCRKKPSIFYGLFKDKKKLPLYLYNCFDIDIFKLYLLISICSNFLIDIMYIMSIFTCPKQVAIFHPYFKEI